MNALELTTISWKLRPRLSAGSLQLLFLLGVISPNLRAQNVPPRVFTHADTLRGSNTPARAWWDASFYDLHVKINPADSSISGYNAITYRVLKSPPN
ncbi:MAG: hypothetical protein ACJ8AE_02875, partial [Gemmatimonadaceae bacterium]